MMQNMAALIGWLIDDALTHVAVKHALTAEREVGESQEQFIAVVAHDFRNPLGTMHAAAEILLRAGDEKNARLGERLRKSVDRMTGLVDNLVDFSRGRAGRAMPVALVHSDRLASALHEVVDEVRQVHGNRDVRSRIVFDALMVADSSRPQQLLSNLLGNALAYGAPDQPVGVVAFEDADLASIGVTNGGAPIAPEALDRLFDAYWNADGTRTTSSMGLGLHIYQLVARAHHGMLRVSSCTESGTRFIMEWPSGCSAV